MYDKVIQTKVLEATRVEGAVEGVDSSYWSLVSAGDIAKHVGEGWTVEAVQWSDTPGEALCVVLRRSSR